jgi:hypothetical protein
MDEHPEILEIIKEEGRHQSLTTTARSVCSLPQSRLSLVDWTATEHRQTTSELEFEKRLEARQQQIRKRSFLRHALILGLSRLALVSLEMASRLDR